MTDQNFDPLAERFAKRIYGSEKGEIRLAIVWQQLLDDFPELVEGRPLRILDIGAGMGQVSLRLAKLGHSVVLTDPSIEMLHRAKAAFAEAGFDPSQQPEPLLVDIDSRQPQFVNSALQALPAAWSGQFDLVVFHAVMEWLAQPFEGLDEALRFVAPEAGRVSVMFYNRHSLVFRNVIRGNFRKVQSQSFKGDEGGLTPQNPLLPEAVKVRLEAKAIDIQSVTGVRVFTDYMNKALDRSLDDKIAIERLYCCEQPYASLARYVMYNGRTHPEQH
ncbi:MAG: methyltransferase domain-containing protein [Pseudomonadales bacterium]|nr:methyltransferase domain-containing protein [Pseudomonadales bacterium]